MTPGGSIPPRSRLNRPPRSSSVTPPNEPAPCTADRAPSVALHRRPQTPPSGRDALRSGEDSAADIASGHSRLGGALCFAQRLDHRGVSVVEEAARNAVETDIASTLAGARSKSKT